MPIPNSSVTPLKLTTGLGQALLLALALLVVSFTRIVGNTQSMEFRSNVLDSVLAGTAWGTALATNLMLFGAAMVLAHLMFGFVCWLVARASMQLFGTAKAKPAHHVWLWFLLLTAALLCANAASFPRSSLGEPYAGIMTSTWGALRLGTWLSATAMMIALGVVLAAAARTWREGRSHVRRALGAAASFMAIAVTASVLPVWQRTLPAADKPNVILIGLDSIRVDLIAPETSPHVTPTLASFMGGSTWFIDATTPLARTFPSVISLLTGRQPHKTGAYMNLLPRDLIKEGDTLGRILGRAGYQSLYATDEVRFSNIDGTFGFDQIITPPIGASEFVISRLADTPVSNLLINTAVGKLLFPHVHSNRGAAVTYDPDRFIARIANEAKFQAPFFLTAHLTLSHWPYTWADAPQMKREPEARWPEYYLNAARRADAQLASLLQLLERRGALANAIVVVYSDHGEAFGIPHESLAPEGDALLASLGATPKWGHGVSVLSPHQYKVVLGIRGYGPMAKRIPNGRTVDAPVTLMDVAPTLVEMTSAVTDSPFDGSSLLALMNEDEVARGTFARRVRFTETEFSPSNIANQDGQLSTSAIESASRIYRLDPRTDRLEVKHEKTANLRQIRQYAAMGDKLLLAAIPGKPGVVSHHFLVVDRAGGLPRRLSQVPGVEAAPEVRRLWRAIHDQFGDVLLPEGSFAPVAISSVAESGQ